MSKTLTIGQMRQSVEFLTNFPTNGATVSREPVVTGKNDDYSIFLITRGKLTKRSGNRGLSFGLIEEGESWDLICRFQSALESNLRTDTKIVIDGKTFTPKSWEKQDQINHIYKFVLVSAQV